MPAHELWMSENGSQRVSLEEAMRLAALIFLAPLAVISQVVGIGTPGNATAVNSTTNAQPTTPVQDLATIEGQVVDGVTGSPLRKAILTLRRMDPIPGQLGLLSTYGTTSDTGGKFAMKDLEPGKYMLSVTRSGYVNMQYGARGPNKPGVTLSLNRAQQLKEVNFRLTPHGVISGRIVDEDGDPVSAVFVQAQSYRYFAGKKQLMSTGGNSTNDLGEFRIYGLGPGKYYLSASYGNAGLPIIDRSATPQPDEDYVVTYYPGTIDAGRAVQLDVTPGAQLSNITMSLSRARTVRVSGRVTMSGIDAGPSPMVMLAPRGVTFFGVSNRPTPLDRAGKFEIRGVTPGSYWLTANLSQGNKTYSARQPVDVGSSNIDNVMLSIGSGAHVTGVVRIDGETSTSLTSIRVTLQSREPGGLMGRIPNGNLKDDGSFDLENVPPDRYNLFFPGMPEGFYVKSIRTSDSDVLASGLDLTSSASAPVEVVLSPRAGEVTGVVQNTNTQQPAPGATVVLIPKEENRRDQQAYYKTTTTDQSGTFTLKSVSPGEYKAYAWEDIDLGAYLDPDFMKPFESGGETVSVSESGRLALQLTLIPADAARSPQ